MKLTNKLTKDRKKELDRMSEEDVYYFWNIFTEEERQYINQTSINIEI
jgi:hypothetical protein